MAQAQEEALDALQRTHEHIAGHFDALICALQARADELRASAADSVSRFVKEVGVRADAIEMNQALLHSCAAFARQEVEREVRT